ncbi:uncharacterized [Tachysurus ichikawai]
MSYRCSFSCSPKHIVKSAVSQQKTESAVNLQLFGKAISVALSNFSPEYFIEQKPEEREEEKEKERTYSQYSKGLTVIV